MEITPALIHHVSGLARIRLTDEEVLHIREELISIIEAFSRLDRVETDDVNPSFHSVELRNVTGEDVPKKCLSNEEALSNTSNKKDFYFKGPKII